MFMIVPGEDRQLSARLEICPPSQRDDSLRSLPLESVLALTGRDDMLLSRLCEKIATFEALDHAIILASECYVTNTFVQHRYIILQLYYHDQNFWIRLDRRRGQTGMLSFIFGSSTSPPRDTVNNLIKMLPVPTRLTHHLLG